MDEINEARKNRRIKVLSVRLDTRRSHDREVYEWLTSREGTIAEHLYEAMKESQMFEDKHDAGKVSLARGDIELIAEGMKNVVSSQNELQTQDIRSLIQEEIKKALS